MLKASIFLYNYIIYKGGIIMSEVDKMFKLMKEYEEQFKEGYALMVIKDPEQAITYMKEAMEKNTSLGKLYPNIFGAREGHYI